jgi:hypothetical protein
MNVVIRVSDSDRARAWGFLVRHSPGTALPNNTFIVSEAAARGLRDAGVDFEEISRDQQPADNAGAALSERI